MSQTLSPELDQSRKWRSITLLVVSQIAAMSLWFVSAAILVDMTREVNLTAGVQAALSSAVQAGFVVGAIVLAVLGVADRYQPRFVIAIFAMAAAIANAMLLIVEPGSAAAITLRAITGACLAGVYPVGMKIAVGWGQKDRGLLVGLLVGGLTLGSAAPHLLAFFGGVNWRITVATASVLGFIAAMVIMGTGNGPYHVKAAKFNPKVITTAWTDKSIRRAYGGYLGHMWELYAMWSWIGVALAYGFSQQLDDNEASEFAKLIAFLVIAIGAVTSATAGWIADRIGKAELTILAMAGSGISALLFAFTLGGPVWFTVLIALVWGATIIPDSAQFSVSVADHAKAEQAGSLLTFQTALGFALTIVTVQLTPVIANHIGWSVTMALLALGPLFGIYCMWQLRQRR